MAYLLSLCELRILAGVLRRPIRILGRTFNEFCNQVGLGSLITETQQNAPGAPFDASQAVLTRRYSAAVKSPN